MFRLAHISDVHLSPMPRVKWQQLIGKRITGYLNWKLNRKHVIGAGYLESLMTHLKDAEPDHIAVTGDLVNLSLPLEFIRARNFLDELGSPENVSVVCGNHDAYVPGALRRALAAWQPYLGPENGDPVRTKKDFPYLLELGDIALIGCNSADATAPFFATGYFRRRQAKKLADLLEQTSGKCRIVMIHHPPVGHATAHHKRLIGANRFQRIIAKYGAELVLHGHTHLPDKNEISGPDGPVPVIGVPAAGNGLGNHRPAGRYNLFEIEEASGSFSINWKAYGASPETGEIEELENAQFYRTSPEIQATIGSN